MDAIDVARYIVTKGVEMGYPVSNLKLQKLLYFVQGLCLSAFDKPAFEETIEAWQYGPAIPSVYFEFSLYGPLDINRSFQTEIEDKEIRGVVLFILNKFKDTEAFALVKETHREGSPWEQVYNKEDKHIKIPSNEIKKYFKEVYLREWFKNE